MATGAVQACSINGLPGYQFGDGGTCYTYADGDENGRRAARVKANQQGMQRGEKEQDRLRSKMRAENAEDEGSKVKQRTDAQIELQKQKEKTQAKVQSRATSQPSVRGVHSSRPDERYVDGEPAIAPLYDKADVSYGPGKNENTCGNCRFFSDGSCQLVKGAIDADDSCRLFSPTDYKDLERDEPGGEYAKGLTERQLTNFYELKDVTLDDVQGTRRSWVPVFPEGHFEHPEYGTLDFTLGELRKYVMNFRKKVRKIDIAVDIDHKNEDAVGWLKDLEIREGVGLFGLVEWNQHGAGLIADKRYRYISPQFGEYVDEESGTTYDPVLVALTITNFPFLKSMAAVKLRKKEGGMPTVTGRDKVATGTRLKKAEQAKDADELEELANPTDDDQDDTPAKPPFGAKKAKKGSAASELDELDDEASELDEGAELDDSSDDDSSASKAKGASDSNPELRQLREQNAAKDRRLAALEGEMRETQRILRLTAVRDQTRQLADRSAKVAFSKPVMDAFKEVALADKKAGNQLFKILSMIQRDGVVGLSVSGRAADPEDDRNDPTGHGSKMLRDKKTGKPIVGTQDQKRAQMYAKEHELDWDNLEDRTKSYLATINDGDVTLDDDEDGIGRID